MSDTLIIAAVGEFSDGDTVRSIGVSTRRFHDSALAGVLEYGTFLPVLTADGLRWGEEIRHQPQGGTTTIQVSDLDLINTEGTFDDWASYTVAGLTWTVKRGRPDQAWADWETIFVAVGTGAPEFTGRERMTIRLRDPFAAFSLPVSTQVFDTDVPNERYANRLVPVVYGDVTQVDAPLIDPPFFRHYAAGNLAVVRRVTEGGTPTDNWFEVDNGFQITQSVAGDTLPIRCDIAGPPVPDAELVDVLSDYGDLATWSGSPAEPDGFVVYSEPTDSQFTEDATNGGGLVETTLVAGTGSDDLTAGTVAVSTANAYQDATGYDTGGTPSTDVSDWPGYLNANDAAYVAMEMLGQFIITQNLDLTNFSGAVASTKTITGIEVAFRAQAAGSGNADITYHDVRLLFPNGSVGLNQANSEALGGTKAVQTYGASDDLWGAILTPDLVNAEGFGVRIRFRADNGTVPVEARLFEVVMTIHHNDGSKTVRIYANTATDSTLELETNSRYRLRLTYDDRVASPEDTVQARWAAVDAIGDAIPRLTRVPGSTGALTGSENYSDPSVITEGLLQGSGTLEGEFIADGPVFGIEFFPQSGQTGDQRIVRIELEEISIAFNTLKDLIRKLAEEAGYDPDTQVDNAALDAIETATGTPRLGWYVRGQAGRDQLATIFAHSCASTVWGGIDGEIKAAMFCLPGVQDWDSDNFLSLDGDSRNMGDSVSVADKAPDLRDRTHAAQNVDPLRDNETAGVTDTWPESERQEVLADWRITERADFDVIQAGTAWPLLPVPTISSIVPASDVPDGGASITITGAGFISSGLSVTFGGTSAGSVTLVSATEITCEAPAGTGTVDVVVSTDGGSATESNGFQYLLPVEWVVADQKTNSSGNSTVSTKSIDAPDNIQAGDLLVFILAGVFEPSNLEASGASGPTGFTFQAEGGNSPITTGFDPYVQVYTKVATGSEPSSYSYDMNGPSSSGARGHIAVLGRVPGGSFIGDSAGSYSSSATTHDAPSVNVASSGALLVCVGVDNGQDFASSPPSGMTMLLATSTGTSQNISAFFEEMTTAGATGARSIDFGGFGDKSTFSFVIEP